MPTREVSRSPQSEARQDCKEFVSRQRQGSCRTLRPDLAGHGANHKTANMNIIELKQRLGQALDDQDSRVIVDRDTLAEDSEHWTDFSNPGPQIDDRVRPDEDAGRNTGNRHRVSGRRDPSFTDGRRPTG